MAAPVTPQEALNRLNQDGPAKIKARAGNHTRLAAIEKDAQGSDALYIYNTGNSGYMILPADDNAYPLLGYTDSGNWDAAKANPAVKAWLSMYAQQIQSARNANKAAKAPAAASTPKEAISPMITTRWNQDAPYNDECPLMNNQRTYTGCVATSMAQVMNYFKYPQVGTGIKQYTASKLGKRLTMNFAQREFDWANMLNDYYPGTYTEAQSQAVAYLMKAAGYSVEMNYGLDASGANSTLIGVALRDYFNYDQGTHIERRLIYSAATWADMLYDNLKNVGPFVLDGNSPLDGGHSFVCDGYDGNGYFHINWGWGGESDGYYALEALNPESQGIGGSTGGFNFEQDAILGAKPAGATPGVIPAPTLGQYGSSTATVSGNILTFSCDNYNPTGWINLSDRPIALYIGAEFAPVNGGTPTVVQGKMGTLDAVSLGLNNYYPTDRVKPFVTIPSLAAGQYKVTLVTKEKDNAAANWIPVNVPWGYRNYVMLTVNSNGSYKVETVAPATLVMSDVTLTSALYPDTNVKVKATFTNSSDIDLCLGVAPQLINGTQIVYLGESIQMEVPAGQTVEHEWITRFYTLNTTPTLTGPTEYTLAMYNPQTDQSYGTFGKVTIAKSPGRPSVMLTGMSIQDAERGPFTVGDRNYPSVSFIQDPAHFVLDISFKVRSGYFDSALMASIYTPVSPGSSSLKPVETINYDYAPMASAGEEVKLNIPVSFPEAETNTVYYASVRYMSGYSAVTLGQTAFVLKDGSSIDGVEIDDLGEVEYYNLQGVKIENPRKGELVIMRAGGKSVKMIF